MLNAGGNEIQSDVELKHPLGGGWFLSNQVAGSRAEAEKDNVVVPLTLEDYCIKTKAPVTESTLDMADFYDDDYDLDDDDDDNVDDDDAEEDGEDSGNDNS